MKQKEVTYTVAKKLICQTFTYSKEIDWKCVEMIKCASINGEHKYMLVAEGVEK